MKKYNSLVTGSTECLKPGKASAGHIRINAVEFERTREVYLPKITGFKILISLCLICLTTSIQGQTTRTAITSGNWSSSSTWNEGQIPTTNDPVIIPNAINLTCDINATCASITFTGANASLSINSGVTLTVTSFVTLNNLTNSNSSCSITGNGTLNCSNVNVGSNAQPGTQKVTYTTTISSTLANFNISNNLTINSNIGTNDGRRNNSFFQLSSGVLSILQQIITTNQNAVNISTFSMSSDPQTGILILSGSSPFSPYGTGISNFYLDGESSTVNYNRAGNQTVRPTTYTNLTLSESGIKTTTGITVNGTLSMEGTATASATPTYGANATLQYNTSTSRNTGLEWPATSFNSTGGVVIRNTGTITLGANKTFSGSPLTILDGSHLSTGSYTLASPNSLILYCGGLSSGSTISGSGLLTLGGDVTVTDAGHGTAGATISCPVALGATRTFAVADGGTNPATDLTVSGTVSGPTFGITKAGVGTMVLSGTNSFSGAVTINAGILSVNTVAATGTNSALGTGSGTPAISISGSGTLRYTGSGHSTNRAITLTGSGATIDASGSDALTLSGTISGSGYNLVLTGSGIGIKSNPINISAGTLTKSGTGTWTLSGNNVIGPAFITDGVLKLGTGGGSAKPLGDPSSATTVSNGATLDLNGYSTEELLILNGDGHTSAGGALANTSGNFVTSQGNIVLGSNSTINTTGDIDISGVISGNFILTKAGSGNLFFTGINTFSGGLIINSGTVQLNSEGCLADNLPVTLAGGSLATGEPGYTEKVGTLSVTNTSSIALGSGVHSLTFDDSHELTWSGSALLTVYGWTGNGLAGGTAGKILVGLDGLTSTQLGQFRFDGFDPGADLLNGEVVPPYQNSVGDYQSHTTTGDWNTTSTWERWSGSEWITPAPEIPIATSLVLIRNGHTVNIDASANAAQIIIEDGATLTLSSSGQADADIITNFGTLNLNSDAGGIASLIVDSYADYGDENIQLYLTGGGNETNYPWHYISTPISGLSTSSVMTGGGPDGSDLVEYDESLVVTTHSQHAAWMGYDGWNYQDEYYSAPGFGSLILGKGYNYYSYSGATRTFSGSFNTVDVTDILLSYSGPGDNPDIYGWNLVGNPFTASIFWDYINKSFDVDDAIYFTTNNTYVTYVAGVGVPGGTTGNIPPMQGFFVKANSKNQYINFLASTRLHSDQNRYKGTIESIPLVRLKLENETVSDETAIRFDKSANLEFDHNLDAYKFSKTGTKVSLWSNSDKISYSINSIPYPETEIEIPLGINVFEEGSFKLNATQIEGLGDYGIFLTDKTTGTSVNLRTLPELSFSASAGLSENRFVIKIVNMTTGVEKPGISTDKFNIYSGNGFINIQTLSDEWNGKQGSVGIVDMTGRTIILNNNMEFWKNSLIQIPSERYKGLYFVKIESGLMRYVGKVMIR